MDKMPGWTQKDDDIPQQNKYIFYKNEEINRIRNSSASCRLAQPPKWNQAWNTAQNISGSQKARGTNGFAVGKSFWCSTILQTLTVRVGWHRMKESVFTKLPLVLHCAPKHWENADDALPVPTPHAEHRCGQRNRGKWVTSWVIAPCRGGELGVNSARISAQGTLMPTTLPCCHPRVPRAPCRWNKVTPPPTMPLPWVSLHAGWTKPSLALSHTPPLGHAWDEQKLVPSPGHLEATKCFGARGGCKPAPFRLTCTSKGRQILTVGAWLNNKTRRWMLKLQIEEKSVEIGVWGCGQLTKGSNSSSTEAWKLEVPTFPKSTQQLCRKIQPQCKIWECNFVASFFYRKKQKSADQKAGVFWMWWKWPESRSKAAARNIAVCYSEGLHSC